MGKLSKTLSTAMPPGLTGPLTTEKTSTVLTGNGGAGFAYDTKSELFLLAVANFVGEDTYYEDAKGRDTRYRDLIRHSVLADPAWTANLLRWLRHDANMRSASIVGAVEAAKALSELNKAELRPKDGSATPRGIMNSVLVRADEPAEALGYWLAVYGKPVPKWLKRALGDAAARLYTPFNVLKWDSTRNPVRMADVVEFSQAKQNPNGVYKYLLDDRHGRGDASEIAMFSARRRFEEIPVADRRALLSTFQFAGRLHEAGLTWEAVSGWLQGPMDAEAWQACIPLMRYGAVIKNLANFDRAGISKPMRDAVIRLLTEPFEVKNSRLLPMAFLSAYNNVPGDTYKAALDEAATLALSNITPFAGRTLILIDTSGSMNTEFTAHRGRKNPDAERLMRWDAAALFGIALAGACAHADVVSFSSAGGYRSWGYVRNRSYEASAGSLPFELKAGENLLKTVGRFRKTHFIGGGTDTGGAIATHYKGHDRVVILTDEQADAHPNGIMKPIPADKTVYTFNLAGYRDGHAATGVNRYSVAGLSDSAFKMMNALENSRPGSWPWSD